MDNKETEMGHIGWLVFGAIFGLLVGSVATSAFYERLSLTRNHGVADTRAEAIDHNAAEWRIDPKTGERSFHWKSANQQTQQNSYSQTLLESECEV